MSHPLWYSIRTMMNELDNAKEEMAFKLFGRSRTLAIAGGQCVKCGFPHNLRSDFRDALSHKEYGISGLCQGCQDGIFGVSDVDRWAADQS